MNFSYKILKQEAWKAINKDHLTLKEELAAANDFIAHLNDPNFSPVQQESSALLDSLVKMREELQLNKQKDERIKWSSEGLAKVGEILRDTELDHLYDTLISFLVHYTRSTIGSLFIVESPNDNPYLELKAAYAYERKKFLEKKVMPGEGLLGQCYLEKEVVYLKEIPKDYLQITSGLGEATPKEILIVPLMNNETVLGIVELASFETFHPYLIDFLQKAGMSIAVSINAIVTNEMTKQLLKESQQQTEELRAQEEEMRQNMEEMQATQEEINRISNINNQILEQAADAVISIDHHKQVTLYNPAAEKMFGYTKEEVLGQNVKMIVPMEHRKQHDNYVDDNVRTGENKVVGIGRELEATRKDGSKFWMILTLSKVSYAGQTLYTAFIKDVSDKKAKEKETLKLLHESQQQTEELRAQEEELRQNMEELQAIQDEVSRVSEINNQILEQAVDAVISIDQHKNVTLFNAAAEAMFGYSREEVMGQNVKVIVPMQHRAQHDEYVDSNVRGGQNKVVGKGRELKATKKDGTEFWILLTLSKVESEGVTLYTAFIKDLTEQKEREALLAKEVETLKKALAKK